ncbi:MAG: BREX system P-loop protein BrxC [Deltaproteobacteria bacterium]|nr:BREX system P-loop protein BrxC [Deltaproteobacteria bacterium]
MKITEILQRDPKTNPLVNQGQARIVDRTTAREVAELKAELGTFVCEGEYSEAIQRILSSYLANLQHTSQKAAWVSGFFGSGKSHLLKMLCHLWQDTAFDDGSTARSLVPALPQEIRALLRELDTAGKRAGGLLAAAGSLPGGTTDNVRLTVLGVLLRGADLPEQYAQARFCLWLHERGFYDRVREAVTSAGKSWDSELNNLYVSDVLAKSLLGCDPAFAPNEVEARKTIRAQFDQPKTDIPTNEFLRIAKQALALRGRDGRLPCTLLVLDEVQQYIGGSVERSTLVTEVVEAISKQLDGHVMVVGAGQSALSEQQLFHKMLDRFTIRAQLSDTDVEAVTRKVLLQKKPAAVAKIREFLKQHDGEISRQLHGSRVGASMEDDAVIVDDYPLLPVRRRFWEHVFRAVDLAGTHSQLRSQLRIIHDAVSKLSDRELGAVVAADELYEALAPEMVNTGALLREINERIIKLSESGTKEAKLARRIAGLVFLIGRLPREGGADIGVRATKDHLADLLVDDLRGDNGKLRSEVEATLASLAQDGVLMQVGDEYRLQTREGSEWDREYRNRLTRVTGDEVAITTERERLLYGEIGRVLGSIRLQHGKAKETRQLAVHRDQTPPPPATDAIPVWIRDGWSGQEKDMVDAARRAGADGAVVYTFLARQAPEDFREAIVESLAAQQALDARGHPTTPEGQEARRSMESRVALATKRRDDLVRQIVANAKVFQGGGSEVLDNVLDERLRSAASASITRLYPQFDEADALATAWDSAIKRARDGADHPLQPVGHTGPIEDHPVCRQVRQTIGAGATGTTVRKALRAAPYGWPQDAIDAALIALHRTQHVTVVLNGVPVQLGQLDQNKIAKAEFKAEKITLNATDRIAIRSVFSSAGVNCKSNEEGLRAGEFLAALGRLADAAGGDAPLPQPPSQAVIQELRALVGNEQLVAIRNRAEDLKKEIESWKKTADLAAQRRPTWALVEHLTRHAASIPAAREAISQAEAIWAGRMLLEPNDPATPVRAALAGMLRQAVTEANSERQRAYTAGTARLESSSVWKRLPGPDQTKILSDVALVKPGTEDVRTDEALLAALDRHTLEARRSEADAVAGRVERALELAARALEPKVQMVSLERATLRTEAEVGEWLDRQKVRLTEALKHGPVFVS